MRLGLLLTLFVALHALYNWAIPLGEGPDEPGHLAYVLFLAEQGRLPVQGPSPASSEVPGEGHQPPLAYLLSVPLVAWLPNQARQIQLTANPDFVWAGGNEAHAFMRGSRERWPWQDLTLAWHLVRAGSGLWGLLTVALTFLAARHLAPTQPNLALLAAALVAFNPQVLFTTALVTNDAMLMTLGAACLWWSLRPAASPWRWAMGAGLLFGLTLLTKQSGLLLGPLLLWGGWRVADRSVQRFVSVSLIWGSVALLIAGWWFGRNLALYGDLFGLGVFAAKFAGEAFRWSDLGAWQAALHRLLRSFWAYFGWMSVPAPVWVYAGYALLGGLALLGGGMGLLRRQARRAIHNPKPTIQNGRNGWIGVWISAAMAWIWLLSFVATTGLVGWQGRMLFPALAAWALLLAGGIGQVIRPLQANQGANHAMVGITLMLMVSAAWQPLGVIRPAYTWVALAPQVAQAQLGTPTYARYAAAWERGVELRGWRVEGSAQAGLPLQMTLTWHSLEPIPRPWTVFVHLVDANGQIVAESNRQPRDGTLPFPRWTVGDWIADPHLIELPATLPPGQYQVLVGLYLREDGGARQAVWAADGTFAGDLHAVGKIELEE